jgi:hypothetical protein
MSRVAPWIPLQLLYSFTPRRLDNKLPEKPFGRQQNVFYIHSLSSHLGQFIYAYKRGICIQLRP